MTDYDVCIIGGGATGAGCALDAQLRGLRTILIEANDFASKTSSASTKMAHGGVRYLQAAVTKLDVRQYRLVRDALRERAVMIRNAPQLAAPLEFVVPCFSRWEQIYYGIGLKTYDWIAGKGSLGASRVLSKAAAVRDLPLIQAEGLTGAATYTDGQFDDARYCLALVLTFVANGGMARNYTRVIGFEKQGGRIVAASVEDQFSKAVSSIRAKAFVNATGPFSDAVRRLASGDAAPRLSPSKGVHILFPMPADWGHRALLVPKTEDGRVIFALPYHGRLMVGTTDTPAGPATEMLVTGDEIGYLLRQVNPYLSRPLAASQIVSGFAGLRPLVRSGNTTDTAALIRDDEVEVDPDSGLISILGGKWTTYRLMAERTINRISTAPSRTHATPLVVAPHEARSPGTLPTRDEVVYAVRHEMARTVEDVLARRIGLELYDWRLAMEAAPMVAEMMGVETAQLEQYVARIRRLLEAASLPPVQGTSQSPNPRSGPAS
jgi:glycerol-3-phosphate dehydrogenase